MSEFKEIPFLKSGQSSVQASVMFLWSTSVDEGTINVMKVAIQA